MAERSIAPVLKTGILKSIEGSNPSLSEKKKIKSLGIRFYLIKYYFYYIILMIIRFYRILFIVI